MNCYCLINRIISEKNDGNYTKNDIILLTLCKLSDNLKLQISEEA
jgi:hypothetical protein